MRSFISKILRLALLNGAILKRSKRQKPILPPLKRQKRKASLEDWRLLGVIKRIKGEFQFKESTVLKINHLSFLKKSVSLPFLAPSVFPSAKRFSNKWISNVNEPEKPSSEMRIKNPIIKVNSPLMKMSFPFSKTRRDWELQPPPLFPAQAGEVDLFQLLLNSFKKHLGL